MEMREVYNAAIRDLTREKDDICTGLCVSDSRGFKLPTEDEILQAADLIKEVNIKIQFTLELLKNG
jgi:hypothetical protein